MMSLNEFAFKSLLLTSATQSRIENFILCSFLSLLLRIKRERNEPKKEKNAKVSSVAARRGIKWMQLKAKPSTPFARYRGYAARSQENPPTLTRHLPYKGGL